MTTGPAAAWQFRELGRPDAVSADATQDGQLEPTGESFVAPNLASDASSEAGAGADGDERSPAPSEALTQPGTRSDEAAPPMATAHLEPRIEPITEQPTALQVTPDPAEETEDSDDPPAKPEPLDAPAPRLDVRTARFNNAQPGTTTLAELQQMWGQPLKVVDEDPVAEDMTLVYKVPSFRQVDVAIKGGLVASIVVHLDKPLPASHIVAELGLAEFVPVPVPDELGEVLGQAYPERGLLFNFTDELDALRVTHVVIEPVSAELFRLRAQHDFDHRYQASLSDLEEALRLKPQDPESHWLKAEVLDAAGRSLDALVAAETAVDLAPTGPVFRLTRARLLAKTGQLDLALEESRAVLDEIDMPHEVAARANCQLGDLLALGTEADHHKALKYHLQAIDLAMKVVGEKRFAIRRMAKRVLIDAHLSVARDIALGNFQRQKEVVPKWLLRATELADEFIADDHGDALLRVHIFRATLATYGELDASFDAAAASEEALNDGKAMIADAIDTLHKRQIERLLAETLFHAAKIERTHGRYDNSMRYANNAMALLENNRASWQMTEHDRYLLGQVYFLVGSLYAVQQENHTEAVDWYRKADQLMVDERFVSPLFNLRDHGEIQVSMGVSYWEIGERETAIELTQKGADLMKQAIEKGTMQLASLAIPYGNLAAMHGKLGNTDRSQEFAELALKIEQDQKETQRR
jgi:tetratricopeptide (TPR) repeat protein